MKRSKYLEHLSHDHYAGLQLAAQLKQGLRDATPPDKLAEIVSKFWQSDLDQHFREEEYLLLPLMTDPPLAVLGRRMTEEHAVLRELALSVRDAPESLGQFSDRLKQHIRFEERELFPAVEASVTDHELLAHRTRVACADAALRGFEEARIAGLCHEGAVENAVAAIRQLDLAALLKPDRS